MSDWRRTLLERGLPAEAETREDCCYALQEKFWLSDPDGNRWEVYNVIEDRVDALVADFPICVLAVLRNPMAGLTTLTTPFTVEPLGIALPADDPLFVNLVENYLNTLEGTGLLTQLKAKWFSDGSWVQELP